MIKNEYKVIGVMSGTSLDGIDLAYITFTFNSVWAFKIETAQTVAYAEKWLSVLKDLVSFSSEELQDIDNHYTLYLSNVIQDFIDANQIQSIDVICSHGHTALHQPKKGLTYQIGNKELLATQLNHTIVCDFRVQDVKLGGQGAPLVPIGDKLLFSDYDFCLNLGGFANISTEINNNRIAYDICPVNIVLNHYVKQLGFDYDDEGQIASIGEINSELFDELNSLPFYQKMYPKSLGLEWVNECVIPVIDNYNLDVKDTLRTFVEHISYQISKEINKKDSATVLVTGGGAFNIFLMKRIKGLSKNKIVTPSKEIIEYKEALIFGLLGVLKLRNETNCLSSVTGAKIDHSSGVIFQP